MLQRVEREQKESRQSLETRRIEVQQGL